ncbi:DUF2510 domain-containing protein [Mycolicibacterium obuense]|uniref:DUF2510 domain-containing protein n=1 Tax=Mycolicibacterium obuense TaxID=1807 RepID=A0A0J6Y8H1_9MYCO|nr:DUF2510 domain-containing protein [Mycolicibacterium obuense]KMO69301.1 hypothetical protein MOBUDSM44075_04726 [Mycolicibacterium obuense]
MAEPGWYPDPLGGQGARYWDGSQWEGAIQPGPSTGALEFPEQPAPPPPGRVQRLWPLWVGLSLALVIAVGCAVFVLTRTGEGPTEAAPPTTPTTTTLKADQVAAEVKSAMQSKLDTDSDLAPLHLRVVHVELVKKAGNEFKGIATVETSRGTSHDVSIDVTADGDKTLWEAGPGAFLFALQEMPTNSPSTLSPPPPPIAPPSSGGPIENFRICPSGLTGVATEDTSCAFADSVRSAWYSQPGSSVVAYSPVTHQSYLMTCTSTTTNAWPGAKRCSGTNAQGAGLIVYIS